MYIRYCRCHGEIIFHCHYLTIVDLYTRACRCHGAIHFIFDKMISDFFTRKRRCHGAKTLYFEQKSLVTEFVIMFVIYGSGVRQPQLRRRLIFLLSKVPALDILNYGVC